MQTTDNTDTEVARLPERSPELAMIEMIERVAMSPDVDIEKMRAILEMRTEMMDRDARVSFNAALSSARAELPSIIKNRAVDFTSAKGRTQYRHEDMAGIAAAIDPVLAKHGLTYRFPTTQEGDLIRVTCLVTHSNGHSEAIVTLEGKPDTTGNKNSFQAVASGVTYLERLALKAALGLASAHDDDGQAAEPVETITGDQFQRLRDLIGETGSDEDQLLNWIGVHNLELVPRSKYHTVEAALLRKIVKASKDATDADV